MVLDDLKSFFSRQARNYQLVLVKKAGFSFFNKLTQDYINIYIRLLGAKYVQLGLVGSVGLSRRLNTTGFAPATYPSGRVKNEGSELLCATLCAEGGSLGQESPLQ